jgi:DNA polymerase III subunit beta
MKVRCRREGLLSAVQLAGAAVAARDIKPVLSNLKVIAKDDACTVLATDLEFGIRLELRGLQVEEAGEALLPAARTLAILRESTDEEVLVEADSQACWIRGQHNEFQMGGEDPAEFPDVPVFSSEQYHDLKAGELREMIRRTIFAAAVENPRYAVTGVLCELDGSKVRLVATDGRRLAVCDGTGTAQGGHSTKNQTHVVPTRSMHLLERNLQDGEEPVQVCLRPNEALFKTERAMIYSRLVEGRYPPYMEVFPKKSTVKIPLAVAPFMSAVRQAAIMTDEETKKVLFEFEKKKLILQAQGAKTGRSKVELPIEYDDKVVKIAFDPKFITDMLRVLSAEDPLTVELIDANSVGLFRSGENYSYIVMPLTSQ